MGMSLSAIGSLRERYRSRTAQPSDEVEAALGRSNGNSGKNVYLAQNLAWTREQAALLRHDELEQQPLWGIPVSIKDCFDLAGFPTSCGSTFYLQKNGAAVENSAVVQRLQAAGALITGKTHLHQLAYGITGENPDFGDCVQPRDAAQLTGGSSSGAAASVQEGSALAAIGTDTGGSIRVPAALCGLAGYRSSLSVQDGLWRGGSHLAESFDTVGWLYRDLADGPLLAEALFGMMQAVAPPVPGLRVGTPGGTFLRDCDDDVAATLQNRLAQLRRQGALISEFDTTAWESAIEIFAPIQAHEAAALHRGNFEHFERTIAQRLSWGASISEDEIRTLRERLAAFRTGADDLWREFDVLILPCCPMSKLLAGADHSQTRVRILRYTAPISLAGWPVVTLPGEHGGLQLIGRMGSDAELLALSAQMV